MPTRLHDIAHARAGDKGNLNTIAVIPYDPSWYPALRAHLTPARVRAALGSRITGEVTRCELPALPALIFLCPRAATDTVTTAAHLDTHGKSLGSILLDLTVDEPGPAGP